MKRTPPGPAERLHPEVVAVMRELGIDLAGRAPTVLSDEAAERADVVVTMGWGPECPYIPGKRYPRLEYSGSARARTPGGPRDPGRDREARGRARRELDSGRLSAQA
jgi:protein-tyrosine-phosphatase